MNLSNKTSGIWRTFAAALRLLPLAALAGAQSGCGDYVKYKDGVIPGGAPIGQTAFDEATRMKLANADHLDHILFDGILADYVAPTADGLLVRVDYDRLKASPEATLLLDQYLATLDLVSPDRLIGTPERFAYWINGYNAAVIRGVVNTYGGNPRFSVSEDNFVFFDVPAYSFGGLRISLNQLEHVIMRGDYEHSAYRSASDTLRERLRSLHDALWSGAPVDARVHVAVNCASLSCPNLRAEAPYVYRAASLESQLDRAARSFVSNATKGAGPNGISQIFNWYAKDFEAKYGNPAGFINQYREGGISGVDFDHFLPYDWSLNILSR